MKTTDFLNENCAIAQEAETMHKDHEVQMARSQLYATAQAAIEIHRMLKGMSEMEGLEGWVQSKITLAADYLNKVRDYLQYEQASQAQEEMMDFVYEEAGYALDNLINGDELGLKIEPKKDEVPDPDADKDSNRKISEKDGNEFPYKQPPPKSFIIPRDKDGKEIPPYKQPPPKSFIIPRDKDGNIIKPDPNDMIQKLPNIIRRNYDPNNAEQLYKAKPLQTNESASAGGTGAGAVATSMGGGNGFANGGPGTLKRIKEQEFKNSAKTAFTKEHKVK